MLTTPGWPAPVHAQAMDVASYRALLRQVEGSLQAVRDAQPAQRSAAATDAAQRLRVVTAVQAGSELIRPHNLALLRSLEREPPDVDAALVALRALADALDRPVAPSDPEPRIRHLRDVLARPEFQSGAGFGALDPVLGPVVIAARRLLYEAIADVGNALLAQGQVGLAVAGGLALGVVASAAVFVWRSVRGSLVADISPRTGTEGDALARSQWLWAEGQQLAAHGEARAAMHAFFLSAAMHLDELGVLPFDPSQTNRELLARLGRAEVRQHMEPLVASFDELWYGHAHCGPDEVERIRGLALQVRSATA
jgi:hypothetical protein